MPKKKRRKSTVETMEDDSPRSPALDQDEPSDGIESQTYRRKSLSRRETDEDVSSSVPSEELRPSEVAQPSQASGKLYATKGKKATQKQVSEFVNVS